jgi:methionyl-tRNA formyltransferase
VSVFGDNLGRPRVAFFGTPEAAVPSLNALVDIAEVVVVVTRPDKPRGRSGADQPSPVKERALTLGLPVAQPTKAKDIGGILTSAGPIEVALVTAFGMLIDPDALAVPGRGFLNVHFSLLPRWRGASPVSAAIAAGDEETGVSIMVLDVGLDTGPVLAARPEIIGRDENAGSLTRRLADLGATLMVEILPRYLQGMVEAVPQGDGATLAPRITKVQTFLDLSQPAEICARKVRALSPRPGAHLFLEGRRIRIAAARGLDARAPIGSVEVSGARLLIGAGGKTLEVLHLQPAGKPEMAVADWLRGVRSHPSAAS